MDEIQLPQIQALYARVREADEQSGLADLDSSRWLNDFYLKELRCKSQSQSKTS